MEANYAQRYEQLYRHHWWWRSRESFLLELLDKLNVPRDANILDIGCGGGWSFDVLRRYGSHVSGVETDAALVDASGDRRSQIYCGPFDRTFQPQRTFQLIVMLDVLEHIQHPQAAMDYAAELLDSGGKIVLTVPAMPMLWTSHDVLNHHFARYTRSTLRPIVHQAGLKLERLEYFFHWLVPLKLAVRAKEAILATKPHPPRVPLSLINRLFYRISRIEQRIAGRFPLPFGSSLLCVASRR
jgi:trans-aconitate methyltransferase